MNISTPKNPYQLLLENLQQSFSYDVHHYIFRISMQSDLDRVKKFGSSRIGLSNKLWDKLNSYSKDKLPKYPILHEEIVIGSYWNDLLEDSILENGTLKHKLEIYSNPFFTIYKKNNLLEIGKENSLGENNQGRHFFFIKPPLESLDSLWQIKKNDLSSNPFTVEKII